MRNTVAELEGYDLDTEQLLERILQDYGLIVAGWSARYDPALRDAIAAHYSTRLTMTWIERSSSSEDAAQLRTLKRGALATTEADAAFGRLADGVTALATRGSRHPLTIPVAVETAKRELAGRPVAIGLHDTLRRELDQLHDRPEFHVFNQRDADPYEDLLGRVEEATLLPSALLATLSYWGDDETDRWWIPEIPRFTTGVAGSGSVKLLNLRIVSGSMLFYAAGVSAVAAQRYHLLHQLFAARRPHRQTGNYETLAASLDASASYEGIPNRDTRLLSNLAPVLGESLQVGSAPLDDAWQMFEVLRAAWAVSRHPRFEELRTEYGPADLELRTAEEAYEKALQQTGASDQTLQTARHTAWQSHGRILGSLGRLANIGRPHVLTDQINWSDGRNSSIVARKLIDDLTFKGENHPIVSSGLFKSHEDAVIATQAVDTNFGAIGYYLKFENMPATGFIPTEIWLDGSTSRQNDE